MARTKINQFIDRVLKERPQLGKTKQQPTEDEVLDSGMELVELGYMPLNREAFSQIATWHASKTRKGLFLLGDVGTGKTHLMKCLLKNFGNNSSIRIRPMQELVMLWHENKGREGGFWYDAFGIYENRVEDSHNYILDDVGQEQVVNYFGEKMELFSRLITRIYAGYEQHGNGSYITTNLTRNEFISRYGARVADRIADMCETIEFKGKTLRGSNTTQVSKGEFNKDEIR
jgi:DNA replication protein DnaC